MTREEVISNFRNSVLKYPISVGGKQFLTKEGDMLLSKPEKCVILLTETKNSITKNISLEVWYKTATIKMLPETVMVNNDEKLIAYKIIDKSGILFDLLPTEGNDIINLLQTNMKVYWSLKIQKDNSSQDKDFNSWIKDVKK